MSFGVFSALTDPVPERSVACDRMRLEETLAMSSPDYGSSRPTDGLSVNRCSIGD